LHLEKSASDLRENMSNTYLGKNELNSRIQNMKSAEKQARAKASRNFLILAHLIASLSSYC